ncbi:MAG: Gfo/Idh/MocA family oxidoreductase [Alphaproteobacteria bacterium]|nr:Gfo/Idh/MocA family oxidoreductase [Alphaproteobacteria bacterium]
MLNTAIIGLGWWGRVHVDAVHNNSDKVKIRRVVDLNIDGVRDFAAEQGLELTADYQDALDDPDVDAVVLVTPHSLHTEQIIAAAAAGKHVFTEKPFALNKADAERAVAAANEAGIQLGLGHNQRYAAPQIEIKRMIDAGELGTIMHLEGNTSHNTLSGFVSWRHDPKEAPGGGLYHMGSHYIDLFCSYVGNVKEVYAQALDSIQPLDCAAALLTFECGASAYVGNVMVTPISRMLNVFGSEGWAKVVAPDELEISALDGTTQTRKVEAVNPVRANMEGFADAIAGVDNYKFTTDQMIHDVAVLSAIDRSLISGKREPVL